MTAAPRASRTSSPIRVHGGGRSWSHVKLVARLKRIRLILGYVLHYLPNLLGERQRDRRAIVKRAVVDVHLREFQNFTKQVLRSATAVVLQNLPRLRHVRARKCFEVRNVAHRVEEVLFAFDAEVRPTGWRVLPFSKQPHS